MAYKFFTVPIQDSGRAEADLNGFLRSHRVLSVDRRWVEQGASSVWSFCVDYLKTSSGRAGDGIAPLKTILQTLRRIGYRGVLSLELFNRDYWKQDALTVARTGLEKMRAAVKSSLE